MAEMNLKLDVGDTFTVDLPTVGKTTFKITRGWDWSSGFTVAPVLVLRQLNLPATPETDR